MNAKGLRCPNYAEKRTSGLAFSTSALGHNRAPAISSSITLAPAKPHCCGKLLNATSAREVVDGVVAQSGRWNRDPEGRSAEPSWGNGSPTGRVGGNGRTR